jgi:hypothetical protein
LLDLLPVTATLVTSAALEILPHSGGIERARQAKRPGERPTSLGEIEAVRIGMQRGAPTRTLPAWIGNDAHLLVVPDHRETQKVGLGRPFLTTHARAHGPDAFGHAESTPPTDLRDPGGSAWTRWMTQQMTPMGWPRRRR